MTRPGLLVYLCGNPVVSLGSLGLLGWMAYQGYTGQVSYVAVIVVAIIAARCWHCASQLQAYARWKREWDAMSGGDRHAVIIVSPALRRVIAVGIWLLLGHVAAANTDPPYHSLAEGWYWLCNLLILGFFLAGLFRRMGRRTKAAKPFDVRVCLPRPRHSPDYRRTYGQLPDYCRRILSQ